MIKWVQDLLAAKKKEEQYQNFLGELYQAVGVMVNALGYWESNPKTSEEDRNKMGNLLTSIDFASGGEFKSILSFNLSIKVEDIGKAAKLEGLKEALAVECKIPGMSPVSFMYYDAGRQAKNGAIKVLIKELENDETFEASCQDYSTS